MELIFDIGRYLYLVIGAFVFVFMTVGTVIKGIRKFIHDIGLQVPDIKTMTTDLERIEDAEREAYEKRVLMYKHPLTMEQRLQMWRDNPTFTIYTQTQDI